MLPNFQWRDVYLIMKNALAQLMAASLLLGCDGLADAHTRPPPLASFRGTLSLSEHSAAPEGDVLLAIMWEVGSDPDAGLAPDDPADPCALDESQRPPDPDSSTARGDINRVGYSHLPLGFAAQQVRLKSEFPVKFTLELTEPPPPEALAMSLMDFFEPKFMASGELVVYRDGNSNGKLDMSTFAHASPDQLLAVSALSAWTRGNADVFVEYIERPVVFDEQRARSTNLGGTPGADEAALQRYAHSYDYLEPGYNLTRLVTDGYMLSYERLPDDTEISLVLDEDLPVQQKLCQQICRKPDDAGCPSSPEDFPPMEAGAWISGDDETALSWYSGGAARAVDGGYFCSIDEFGNHTIEYYRSECQGCVCEVVQCLYRREELGPDVQLPCRSYQPHP
ncbi:MAG TPA: hypothetical protein VJV78_06480 [Polyangiales bacterium]|nr:hypothetical protein [Polyangiales bacterium]